LTRNALSPRLGDFVTITYLDHVFYKDNDESVQTPRTLTAHGLLAYEGVYEGRPFIRVRLESYSDPDSSASPRVRSMGIVILKSAILEIRRANA
jgi:hypothetical protein